MSTDSVRRLLISMTAVAAFVVGCGSDDDDTEKSGTGGSGSGGNPSSHAGTSSSEPSDRFTGSCDISAELALCYNYVGDDWTESSATVDCDAAETAFGFSGTLSANDCPTENAVGTCTHEGWVYYYYAEESDSNSWTQDEAEQFCPGTFVAE